MQCEEIPPDDLDIEPWPRREGGQHVGTTNGIRIEHIPTGIVAIVNVDRSQHRNRTIAMDMILSALTHPQFRG